LTWRGVASLPSLRRLLSRSCLLLLLTNTTTRQTRHHYLCMTTSYGITSLPAEVRDSRA
jgi:hypothetical protein